MTERSAAGPPGTCRHRPAGGAAGAGRAVRPGAGGLPSGGGDRGPTAGRCTARCAGRWWRRSGRWSRDAALRMLRRALQEGSAWAEVAPADDDLKALHGRKEFIELLREAGEWARGGGAIVDPRTG